MNKQKLYNYFASNFQLHKSTHGWHRFANPTLLSKEIVMAVNFDYNYVKCYKTGYSDFCVNFIMMIESVDYREALQLIDDYDELEYNDITTFIKKESVFKLPEHFQPLYSEGLFSERAVSYLEGRGFDSKLLNNMGFGFCDDGKFMGYIIVPFTIQGRLVYYIGRDFLNRPIRYKNPEADDIGLGKADLFFNEDALTLYDEVYMVEGWSDAMTVGKDCIASLGWSLSPMQKSKLIKAKPKLLTIIPDKGFYQKALQTAFGLCEYMSIRVVNLDYEIEKDVNSIGRERVFELLNKTKNFTPKDIFI